jgi:hypothetical protein
MHGHNEYWLLLHNKTQKFHATGAMKVKPALTLLLCVKLPLSQSIESCSGRGLRERSRFDYPFGKNAAPP